MSAEENVATPESEAPVVLIATFDGRVAQRLDAFALTTFAPIASKTAARKLAKRGLLTVDGAPFWGNRFLETGQVVSLEVPQVSQKVYPRDVPVAWEDDHLAVLVKPPGLVVSGNRYRTLQSTLPHNLTPTTESDPMAVMRPVHRLDARTGGLVVCAKTNRAMVALGLAFQERRVDKEYRALLMGRLDGAGAVFEEVDDRSAHSEYRVIRHARALKCSWITEVSLIPHTGRTHQLRKHMQHLGTPILGDIRYTDEGPVLRGKGLFLFARRLVFPHPITERPITVEVGLPAKFGSLLEREERRWRKYFPED